MPERERTILFVEDEEKSRKYFRKIFRRDYEIILAVDGQDGLELFRENKDKIGLVMTDQMMPRMKGLELLAEVEQSAPDVVRILSTAYTDSEDFETANAKGLIHHLVTKPWDLEKVTSTLEEAVEQFRAQTA